MTSSAYLYPTCFSSWAPGQCLYFLHPVSDSQLAGTRTLCNLNLPLTWSNFHFLSDHLRLNWLGMGVLLLLLLLLLIYFLLIFYLSGTRTLCNLNLPLTWSNFHFLSDHLRLNWLGMGVLLLLLLLLSIYFLFIYFFLYLFTYFYLFLFIFYYFYFFGFCFVLFLLFVCLFVFLIIQSQAAFVNRLYT